MNKEYYKEYYHSERNHWFFRARNQIILNHIDSLIKNKKDLRILNVGVATGHTSELLSTYGKVKSIEYDEDCFEFTKNNVASIDLIHGSILELPFEDNSYDLVCAFDVIEHVEDDQLGVNEMKRVCKAGGMVVVTVPAFMSLWSPHDEINHHFKRYKINEVLNLFNSSGEVVYQTYFNFWLFPFIYLYRKINSVFNLTKKTVKDNANTGSDLAVMEGNQWVSNSLFWLLKSEIKFIKRRAKLPFGVSVLSSWKKV